MSFPRVIVAEILAFWVGSASGVACVALLGENDAISGGTLAAVACSAVLSRELTIHLAQRFTVRAMTPAGIGHQCRMLLAAVRRRSVLFAALVPNFRELQT
jgi:hypothetical protein